MRLKPALLTLCLLLPGVPVFAAQTGGFEACAQTFYQSYAPAASEHQPGQRFALCYDDFAVLYSGQSKTPIYSAEHLTAQRLEAARAEVRTDKFFEEARVPLAMRAMLNDYRGSQYDRGHLSPAGDRSTDVAMTESFSLGNIVPQNPTNNRGVWAKNVEKPTRKYALRSQDGIYVFTGPVYSKPPATIGQGHVWVPDQLFKLVFDPSRHQAWAYIVPNTDDARVTRVYSYQDLVQLTGMELLPPGAVR